MLTTAQRDVEVTTISHGGLDEIFVTATAGQEEGAGEMLSRALEPVRRAGATVVSQDIFGAPAGPAERGLWADADWPVTWLSTDPEAAPPSTQIRAVCGTTVRRAHLAGRPAASIYEDRNARWCRLGGLVPEDRGASREEQAGRIFQGLRSILKRAGMDMRHTFRTWLYLDGILGWYGEFNRVRDEFFRRCGMFDAIVPASTGIGAPNAAGAGLVAGALAMRPITDRISLRAVDSPLQCSALDYGSSFSRAVEVSTPSHRRLYVSGTAGIDGQGRTRRQGDFEGQMDLTLRTVEAILHSRGIDWSDTVRVVAYFPRAGDLPALRRGLERLNLTAAVVPAVVCRDDLLFELELDAIR